MWILPANTSCDNYAVSYTIFGRKTVMMAIFEPFSLYDQRLGATTTEISTIVSRCQSFGSVSGLKLGRLRAFFNIAPIGFVWKKKVMYT